MKDPVIIYCCKGLTHICYMIWSIRSLQKFKYNKIEVIVSNEDEKSFFLSHCPNIKCRILNADSGNYPAFSYKPFVLQLYIKHIGIYYTGRDIVICDADTLWKKDPKMLFNRFNGMNWVHKITAINPEDYNCHLNEVGRANIGLITVLNYKSKFGLQSKPNYRVNAGLFMLQEKIFSDVINNWMSKIYSLTSSEMKMSEALLSLSYAEMGLNPICDEEDIKHYGVENSNIVAPDSEFIVADRCNSKEFTGYQTVQHYFGSQRKLMVKHAKEMGVDYDNLSNIVNNSLRQDYFKSIVKKIKKVIWAES